MMFQEENLEKLVLDLCGIDSTTGREGEVCDWLIAYLKQLGFEIKTQKLNSLSEPDDSRVNILATWPGVEPDILLSTHLDTVPPFIKPKQDKEKNIITGRGTCDAKGIAACMIQACLNLKNNNIGEKIGLLFLLEEETCSGGAKLAKNNFAPRVNYIINGEPTELKLTKAAKGVVVFDLEATGQAGHSAYPETGFSAVHILTEDIQKLLNLNWPSDSVLGETTLNFGIIEGGIARNIFAPKAKVQCLARTVVELEEMQEIIKANISEHTEYKFVSYTEPMPFHTVELPENNLETCVVAFGSDAPHLKDLGKIMLIGPGSILDAHTSHEHIKVEDLRKAVKIYENLCVKLLD